jgi:2-polyprenyl-3-methyl-5-hydroxy-6-metoxy-1,4-benzoquinol methylase
MRTAAGTSIYEGDSSLYMTEDQMDYYRDESTVEAARDKVRWIQHAAPGARRLLDVGANFGYFVREASAAGLDARGLEPSARAVSWGREHLRAAIEVGSAYDARPDLAGRFDVVTLFDVIEHLDDPGTAIERCLSYLAPGGRLFITTPDTGSLVARLLNRQWYYIDMIEHVSLFNRQNLERLLTAHGVTVRDTRTMGRLYRLSYIERRLGQLASRAPFLRLAQLAAQPLRLAPHVRLPLNLGDVMGLVATRAGAP